MKFLRLAVASLLLVSSMLAAGPVQAVGTSVTEGMDDGAGWFIVNGSRAFASIVTKGPVKPFVSFAKCEAARKALASAEALKCAHYNTFYISPKAMAVFKPCLQAASIMAAMSIKPCMSAGTYFLNQNPGKFPGNHNEQVNFRSFLAARCFHFAAVGEMQLGDKQNATFLFSATQSILNAITENNVSAPLVKAAQKELRSVNNQLNILKPQSTQTNT